VLLGTPFGVAFGEYGAWIGAEDDLLKPPMMSVMTGCGAV
jgi:hypothetical protein